MLLEEGAGEKHPQLRWEKKYNRKLNHSINSGSKGTEAELWTCPRLLTLPLDLCFSSEPVGSGEGGVQMSDGQRQDGQIHRICVMICICLWALVWPFTHRCCC